MDCIQSCEIGRKRLDVKRGIDYRLLLYYILSLVLRIVTKRQTLSHSFREILSKESEESVSISSSRFQGRLLLSESVYSVAHPNRKRGRIDKDEKLPMRFNR